MIILKILALILPSLCIGVIALFWMVFMILLIPIEILVFGLLAGISGDFVDFLKYCFYLPFAFFIWIYEIWYDALS